ncbi:uncharacterized protein EURHEDRAFT_536892 [Aspergillus ruber CBS 135680]|uniref:Uncharacterized protein n=1 Tax=Aspergillus ruber (strain CBS 135680) TaxID=1388766 RepID=A0A017SF47_ASPRC|nr:uncharacterized protein EURHEDRAFT_536892 [Aspergillus ruber CBS 135680]EYE95269.1 hypothetical protein EURHEDRAFT_536892 [Aspergillus ruber CBS 135680]
MVIVSSLQFIRNFPFISAKLRMRHFQSNILHRGYENILLFKNALLKTASDSNTMKTNRHHHCSHVSKGLAICKTSNASHSIMIKTEIKDNVNNVAENVADTVCKNNIEGLIFLLESIEERILSRLLKNHAFRAIKGNKGQLLHKSKLAYLILGIMTCKNLIARKEMQIGIYLKAEFKVNEPGAENAVGIEWNSGNTITAKDEIIVGYKPLELDGGPGEPKTSKFRHGASHTTLNSWDVRYNAAYFQPDIKWIRHAHEATA